MNRKLLALATLSLLLLVGCGERGGDEPAGDTSSTGESPDTTSTAPDTTAAGGDCWGGPALCSAFRGPQPPRIHAMAVVEQGGNPRIVCGNNTGTAVHEILVCAGDAIVWENQLGEDVTMAFPDAKTLFWSAAEGRPNTLLLRAGESTWSIVREDAATVEELPAGHTIRLTIGGSLDPDPVIKVKK